MVDILTMALRCETPHSRTSRSETSRMYTSVEWVTSVGSVSTSVSIML